MAEPTYTAQQIATAANELREAAGTEDRESPAVNEEGSYTAMQALNLLADEVRLLRERGFTDERIAGLLGGFDIDITADQIARSDAGGRPF